MQVKIPMYFELHVAANKISLKLKCCKPHKVTRHPTICNVINDVKLFATVSQDYAVANFQS